MYCVSPLNNTSWAGPPRLCLLLLVNRSPPLHLFLLVERSPHLCLSSCWWRGPCCLCLLLLVERSPLLMSPLVGGEAPSLVSTLVGEQVPSLAPLLVGGEVPSLVSLFLLVERSPHLCLSSCWWRGPRCLCLLLLMEKSPLPVPPLVSGQVPVACATSCTWEQQMRTRGS